MDNISQINSTIKSTPEAAIKDSCFEALEIFSSFADKQLFKYDTVEDVMNFYISGKGAVKSKKTVPGFLKNLSGNIVDNRDKECFFRFFRQACLSLTQSSVEFRSDYFSRDGKTCWYRAEYKSNIDRNGKIASIIGVINNIDDEKNIIHNVKENAGINSITGFYNYDCFCDKVAKLIKSQELSESTLIILEISSLDFIAAKFSYDYTDVLMRQLAKVIKAWFNDRYVIGHDKERFLLFSKDRISDEILMADCNALLGFAKSMTAENDDIVLNPEIGVAFYPKDGDNVRSLISVAGSEIFDKRIELSEKTNDLLSAYDSDFAINAPLLNKEMSLLEKLFEFVDILFYNFKTFEASHKAFSIIADDLSICRVTECIANNSHKGPVRIMFDSGSPIADNMPYIEEAIHNLPGEIAVYRVYRRIGSDPLSNEQNKYLRMILRTVHTYINRFVNFKTEKFARTHDMILGCLNTNGFTSKLYEYRKNKTDFSKYATLCMNVKKYKDINSKVGYENGHVVIHTIADAFRKILEEDEFFARIGGDNFIALMKKENVEKNLIILNNLPCEIMHNDKVSTFVISFRTGVYMIEYSLVDITEMIENANIAFDFTRRNNMDDVVYYSKDIRSFYEQHLLLERELRPALENGDFLIYFQPKVNLEDYSLVGAEALSRWQRNGVIIPPNSFIPICEQNGMIVDIDFHVYESVCRTLHEWISHGITPVTVSVNFSKITLETPDFANHLFTIASQYDVPVHYLEIEFTETCCMENEKKFNDIFAELKELGFQVSLDDFGKGYSSINMLKNMKFDILKLDRSFLADVDERSRIILQSIIKMAHSLNIEVIVEGVETVDQINYLKLLKCEKAQGYSFDKPLPRDTFEKRLYERKYTIFQ